MITELENLVEQMEQGKTVLVPDGRERAIIDFLDLIEHPQRDHAQCSIVDANKRMVYFKEE